MRLRVNLPQTMRLPASLLTPGASLLPRNPPKVGKEKRVSHLFPWVHLQTPPEQVRHKWPGGCLNYVDGQRLGECPPFDDLFCLL